MACNLKKRGSLGVKNYARYTEVVFSPVSVHSLADLHKELLNRFPPNLVEDGPPPRVDPVNLWCRSESL